MNSRLQGVNPLQNVQRGGDLLQSTDLSWLVNKTTQHEAPVGIAHD